jgi:hypothetical protein
MRSLHVIGFNGVEWLPVRPVPESDGRCWMDTAVVTAGSKLVAFWPTDGRTYADPHVKSAQLRYADFEVSGEPAAPERMKPFLSSRSSAQDAAPTEKTDLARVRDSLGRQTLPAPVSRRSAPPHGYLARFSKRR